MTELAYASAGVLITAIAAYCFLEWLKVFKRRNDLADKFQGYERAQSQLTDAMRLDIDRLDHSRQAFENMLPRYEKLVVRVDAMDAYFRAEISKIGHDVLGQVQEMKDKQVAAFTAPRGPLTGRSFKP